MKKLNINQSKLTNYDYISQKSIKVKNRRDVHLYTNLIFSNLKKEQGLFIAHLSKPTNGYYVLLASLLETLKMGDFEYHLSVTKEGKEFKSSGLKYLHKVETKPYPKLHYCLGTIDLVKSFILSPENNVLFIHYLLKDSPIDVHFELDPLLAYREHNKLSFANAKAQTQIEKLDSGIGMNMYTDFPSLYFLSEKTMNFSKNGHWIRGFKYPIDNSHSEYEDLFCPGRISFTLKPNEEFVLMIGLEKLTKEELANQFIKVQQRLIASVQE